MMNSLNDPSAILVGLLIFITLICIMSKTDPIVVFARSGYALRRVILIAAATLRDIPREFFTRLKAARVRDSAALAELEKPYMTRQAPAARQGHSAQIAEPRPLRALNRKSCQRRRQWPTG
jgi:hypothetical protein